MPNTPLCNISYPNENDDPWYEEFVAMLSQIDQDIFGLQSSAGNLIIPRGTYQFTLGPNDSYGLFSWTGYFEIPILGSGFFLQINTGPDQATPQIQLNDGDYVYVNVPLSSGAPVTGYLNKVNGKVAFSQGLFLVGMMRGTNFFHRIAQQL